MCVVNLSCAFRTATEHGLTVANSAPNLVGWWSSEWYQTCVSPSYWRTPVVYAADWTLDYYTWCVFVYSDIMSLYTRKDTQTTERAICSLSCLCVFSLLCIPRRVSHMINQSINQWRWQILWSRKSFRCASQMNSLYSRIKQDHIPVHTFVCNCLLILSMI